MVQTDGKQSQRVGVLFTKYDELKGLAGFQGHDPVICGDAVYRRARVGDSGSVRGG